MLDEKENGIIQKQKDIQKLEEKQDSLMKRNVLVVAYVQMYALLNKKLLL